MAGESVQSYIRDQWVAELVKLRVEIVTDARLFGVDSDTAYFMQNLSGEAIEMADTDTVVLSLGHQREAGLEEALTDWGGEFHVIGDCLAPRTVEEAVVEGLQVASAI